MGPLLSLLIVLSFGSIFYFWLKRHNKKLVIASVIATVVFTGLMTLTPEYKQEVTKEERQEKADNKKKTSHKEKLKSKSVNKENKVVKTKPSLKKTEKKKKANSSKQDDKYVVSKETLLSRAKKLKYGMSLNEVKSIMQVKPSEEENDRGFINLTYGKDVVDLGFDENKRLTAASTGAPQIQKQGEKAAQQKKKNAKSRESSLKSSAQYFGTKSSESIQNNPSAFKTTQDGDLLYILWNPGDHLPLLLRVDDTSTNITNVYIYNKHGDNPKGRHLYTGRTIVQKKRSIVYY
ncbi:hypothetical protein [Lactobacillus taiwanensis]|nr:hypothetical protein [Lactobacillus taiwanensis]OYR97502.1 hypothetical protein CBF51_03315 [Lactobacillus taiwanensis]OYS14882.1 hypothetical protein CBF69_07260 [Lactobacillus taiwanensis]OYS31789.1 hypothetical protein CBF75_06270 [Lactobacillus taiwanensis]OYS33654.1 hypothetical protein CBF78_05560 [Lactobacillus taiwanensis]OYS35394.1 hypothetical protein CBF85_05965 [Lactobacillus taiwanensis]